MSPTTSHYLWLFTNGAVIGGLATWWASRMPRERDVVIERARKAVAERGLTPLQLEAATYVPSLPRGSMGEPVSQRGLWGSRR
jgi:hypothetical protein